MSPIIRRLLTTATKPKQNDQRLSSKSLALSVHFLHPKFGMKKHEILSRATAFLLNVDPFYDPASVSTVSSATAGGSDTYSHLDSNEQLRASKRLRDNYAHEPAGGPPRHVKDLGWLEFCPAAYRPLVHCVASSHVLAPWKWKNYYPQDWLSQVNEEHCSYSLEVYDSLQPQKGALAKFALNPYPIHHPAGMDLAIIHLKNEEAALKHMEDLGVIRHYLRDNEAAYEHNDEVTFDGYEVAEDNVVDQMNSPTPPKKNKKQNESSEDDDTRVFMPYTDTGNLIFASPERFLASTSTGPLPEGLCGGPVLDSDGKVCGVVEGIVPTDHEDERIAGAASFLPNYATKEFIDAAERFMLEQILPNNMFQQVVGFKDGKGLNEGLKELNAEDAETALSGNTGNQVTSGDMAKAEKEYDDLVAEISKHTTKENMDAIMNTVQREREEVIDILSREGGDMDEVVQRVRMRTIERRNELIKQIEDAMQRGETDGSDGK